jgi:thiol-disulfide isomerase/thioredoxin
MKALPCFVGLCLLAAGCGKCCETEAPSTSSLSTVAAAAPVELKLVKLNELADTIKAQRGKVVVMDVWASWCVPCMKEFPRLVKLHEQYAKDGLACVSLSVDDADDQSKALDFLKARHATFANFLIDERAAVWQNHFVLKGVPAVFLWDRTGKQAARFDNDDPDKQFTYDQVEKKVAELLQNK